MKCTRQLFPFVGRAEQTKSAEKNIWTYEERSGGKLEKMSESAGKRPVGWSKRRRRDNIRMDPREIGWEDVAWMHLAQDRDQWQPLGTL
jgi:hypothetical protein